MTYTTGSKTLLIVLPLISICLDVNSDLIVNPKDSEAVVGSTTFFNCSTTLASTEIHWFHYAVGDTKDRSFVYGYDQFYTPYLGRFQMEKNSAAGAYNLIISSVTIDDAGRYECQDDIGRGDKDSAQMTVLDENPVCQSNMKPQGFIGPNICGFEPEELHLTCAVQYHGNQPPIMQWKEVGSDNPIAEGVTQNISSNRAIYYLKMEVNSHMDGSSYQCQTTRSTTSQYGCTSDVISVKGFSQKYVIIICVLVGLGVVIISAFAGFGIGRIQRNPKMIQKDSTKHEQHPSTSKEPEQMELIEPQVAERETIEKLTSENKRLLAKVNELEHLMYSSAVESRRESIRVGACPWERLRANCPEDGQISIRSAVYGSIGSARCLSGNRTVHGYNCSTDVQSVVKDRCIKRSHCEIDLPDRVLDDLSLANCPKSQLQYLDIVYECQDRKILPQCKSSMGPDGLIGPNSCNVEPEEVQLKCSVDVYDNSPVEIQWMKAGYNKIISGNSSRTSDTFSSVLSMKADLHMDRSLYICIASTSTSNCIYDILKILYVLANDNIIEKKEYDELICIANSNQPCTYTWKYTYGNKSLTISTNQTLIPQLKGLYKCEAECLLRDQRCTVVAMVVQVSPSTDVLKIVLVIAVFAVVCGFISVLIGCCVYHKRKRRGQISDQQPERNAVSNEIPPVDEYEEIDDSVDIDIQKISNKVAKYRKKVNDKESYEDLSGPSEERFYRTIENYEIPLQ